MENIKHATTSCYLMLWWNPHHSASYSEIPAPYISLLHPTTTWDKASVIQYTNTNILHLKKCLIVVTDEEATGLVIILPFLQVNTDTILKYISQAIQI
jgi:hypothetical protein